MTKGTWVIVIMALSLWPLIGAGAWLLIAWYFPWAREQGLSLFAIGTYGTVLCFLIGLSISLYGYGMFRLAARLDADV